jgi:PAS domain S-box-containing protein
MFDTPLFHDAFNASPIGIVIEDLQGKPLYANPAFCAFLGFSEEELRTKHCVDFSPPEDAAQDWSLFQKLQAGSINYYQLEKRYFRRDGSLVWGNLTLSLLNSDPTPLVIAMVHDITEKKRSEEERKSTEEALSMMNRRLIEAQEEERARIGRELHDDVIQRLSLLAVELDQLQMNPSDVRSRLEALRKKVVDVGKAVKDLSHELHSSGLRYLGLVAGLRGWCTEFAERHRIEVDFSDDVSSVVPFEVALCFLRVLQEALNNAVKHGRAKRIEVRLTEGSGEVHLVVSDSGLGFNVEAPKNGRGLGLTSMQERVKIVHGSMAIESMPKGGTTIHVRVPISPEVVSLAESSQVSVGRNVGMNP